MDSISKKAIMGSNFHKYTAVKFADECYVKVFFEGIDVTNSGPLEHIRFGTVEAARFVLITLYGEELVA